MKKVPPNLTTYISDALFGGIKSPVPEDEKVKLKERIKGSAEVFMDNAQKQASATKKIYEASRDVAETVFGKPVASPVKLDPYTEAKRKAYDWLDQFVEGAKEEAKKKAAEAVQGILQFRVKRGSDGTWQEEEIIPTPTPTPTPVPETKSSFAEKRPDYSQEQKDYAKKVRSDAEHLGVNPDIFEAIANNESTLNIKPTPNISQTEESYGPFQINFKIVDKDGKVTTLETRDGLTREDAQDYDKAVVWAAKQIEKAQKRFPDNTEKQILYYNVPGNAYLKPEELSYQGAWYLANALFYMGKSPSSEYQAVIRKYKLPEVKQYAESI